MPGVPASSGGHAATDYFPENLRRHRERKGMSQKALAEAMKACGWSWHQATVHRVESGAQPVELGEATDLAAILGTSLDRLTWAGPEENGVALTDRATALLARSFRETAEAAERLLRDRDGAERQLAEAVKSEYRRVRQAAEDLRLELEASTLEAAVEHGVDRYENPEEA